MHNYTPSTVQARKNCASTVNVVTGSVSKMWPRSSNFWHHSFTFLHLCCSRERAVQKFLTQMHSYNDIAKMWCGIFICILILSGQSGAHKLTANFRKIFKFRPNLATLVMPPSDIVPHCAYCAQRMSVPCCTPNFFRSDHINLAEMEQKSL